ncbi:hypothetical protein ACSK1W_000280 [Vibrio alginolyticus]
METSIVYYLLTFLVGGGGVYVTAYLKYKGRNKALSEDVLRLETEKQNIISFHNKELEKLKQTHALKLQNEGARLSAKKEEYSKFMNLLTEIQTSTLSKIEDDLLPNLNVYIESIKRGNRKEIKKQQENIKEIVDKINDEMRKPSLLLFKETNSIKLICNEKIENLIDQFIDLLDKNTLAVSQMLSYYPTDEFVLKPILKPEHFAKFDPDNNPLERVKNELFSEMRKDFSQISN